MKIMWKDAEKVLSKDKYIGLLIKKYGHCEIEVRKKGDYFVSLVRAITGQQLSVKAAKTIFERLEKKLVKITPKNILAKKDEELREQGLSWAKIKYVKDLAERTLDGRLKVNKLDKLSDEEILTELTAVKGIGRWTAEMFLMFTLGRPDIFPIDDLGIKNGMKRLLEKELDPEKLVKFAQRWKPYRTLASWYIWELLDNK